MLYPIVVSHGGSRGRGEDLLVRAGRRRCGCPSNSGSRRIRCAAAGAVLRSSSSQLRWIGRASRQLSACSMLTSRRTRPIALEDLSLSKHILRQLRGRLGQSGHSKRASSLACSYRVEILRRAARKLIASPPRKLLLGSRRVTGPRMSSVPRANRMPPIPNGRR
jgi:hypothetical protein